MLILGFFPWCSSLQYLSTDLYHMELHKKSCSGRNQNHPTSLRQNLVSWEDFRLPWGGQDSTETLSHPHKGKCWLKQRQACSPACIRCRSPAAWFWPCPGKSVPGSAKCSEFKLKEFEWWLSTGESLIVWVTQSEWEQPRMGKRVWGGPGRPSSLQVPWWEGGFNQSKLASFGQGMLNPSSRCSALSQGGWGNNMADIAVVWKETSLQSSQDRKQGGKIAKKV